MISRHLMGHGLAALVLALIAVGCAKNPKTNPTDAKTGETADTRAANPRQPETVKNATDGSAAEPAFSTAEALKRKTATYSQQVESMIDHGSAPESTTRPALAVQQPPRHTAAKPSKPSDVDWRDPRDPKVAMHGGAAETTGATPPSGTVQPNQFISSNTPAMVEPAPTEVAAPINTPLGPSDAMAQKIEKRVREYPREVSGQLDFQLLRFLQDERVPDLNTISALPTEDRELIAAFIDGLSNFRNGLRQDSNMLMSRKIHPLLEMADRLRSGANLSIPTIALCTTVRTFGEYDPINPPRFAANMAHDVILYCEIENFSSQIDEKQMWQTKLSKDAVLYTESGMPVWSDKSETITDTARRRRHDFFIVKKLRIPANLTVGRYLMKVSIQDQQVNRVAEATLPIVIAAEGG